MNQPRRAVAVHPGEILQEILDQNAITQSLVAQRVNMAQSKISEICRGKRGVTPDLAMPSGGVWGLTEGYSMMVGGNEQVVERLRPILETLAPAAGCAARRRIALHARRPGRAGLAAAGPDLERLAGRQGAAGQL